MIGDEVSRHDDAVRKPNFLPLQMRPIFERKRPIGVVVNFLTQIQQNPPSTSDNFVTENTFLIQTLSLILTGQMRYEATKCCVASFHSLIFCSFCVGIYICRACSLLRMILGFIDVNYMSCVRITPVRSLRCVSLQSKTDAAENAVLTQGALWLKTPPQAKLIRLQFCGLSLFADFERPI